MYTIKLHHKKRLEVSQKNITPNTYDPTGLETPQVLILFFKLELRGGGAISVVSKKAINSIDKKNSF